jgi:nitroreductase
MQGQEVTMLEILKLIQDRHSERAPYDVERPIAKQDLKQILEAARWAPTPHNMQNLELIVVDDKKVLETLANIRYPITDTFVLENYQHLSFSEEELARKKVGLLGTHFPPAMRTPGMALDEATYEKLRSAWAKAIQTSPVLLIVAYNPDNRAPDSEGDFLGHVGLGCVLENMWLMAHSLGISFHVISILSKEPADQELKSVLEIPEHLKIAFGIRLGYVPPAEHAPLRVRRDVEEFTHHNCFGNRSVHC